ncbi:IS256 family transposase [Lysinibacillus sp. SGAir0095]|uniref:IS256 family transposase n=1 Tax=Lysinibacillus sp. SGAir0095 TaxID=2070463 RepID=UPI0010CD05CA|nr:IS256 family transposase [Lysinibacillus sp. SGAir0095]QCR30830.1 IS256 family transposase [Lysinibacillus sp. SGAir0095]QCR31402.1 IS256 family transposase [Lysinibacillus sp. SGAir0095]QCR32312.1 IS256 family transposase [Lysinibacillus sp. SGAir0095]QCR33080.1 IS256 family transposase [Lysinibacillus sp. SGAir0095]QCR33796.1 IS256 family transposase [Lysinibacillus sp. SGAir0095]
MTQLQFNLDMDFLKDSVLNSDLNTVVKSALVLVLNEFMEKERDEYLNAAAYERSNDRIDYRNGYYEREIVMSVGKLTLKVPRTRNGEFSTSVFEKYARHDQALILSMIEMVVNGVSTRKVTQIVEQLCGETVSKSLVSSLTQKLDPIINTWANRPLNTTYYPYIFLDAMYIKVREHHQVVSKAVYIATAITEENKREILGLSVDHVESYDSWSRFLQHLKSRGTQSPKLVISDAHQGLRKAIQREFIGTTWQRCNVHFKRNIIEKLPKKDSGDFRLMIRRIFDAVTLDDMRKFKDELMNQYAEDRRYEKALTVLDEGFEDTIQYMNFPKGIRVNIRSTNSLERLNQEVRRRENVIRIFPNTQSAFRLVGAVLMHYQENDYSKRTGLSR